jgi:hypothetical protein
VQNINCLKKELYMMIHTDIKLGVYVWFYCCYQFNIVSIGMIKDLCMIWHAFKFVHGF